MGDDWIADPEEIVYRELEEQAQELQEALDQGAQDMADRADEHQELFDEVYGDDDYS